MLHFLYRRSACLSFSKKKKNENIEYYKILFDLKCQFFQNEESDSHQVALRGVTLKSSGLYRCEVSAEGPSFFSAQKEGRLEVVCK